MKLKLLKSHNSILFYTLFAGVVLSIASLIIVRNWEQKAILEEFNTSAADRVRAIENAMADNNAALMAIGAFYGASKSVERDAFRNFTGDLLSLHPDILEFRWLLRVKDSERTSYEESMRKEGFTGLVIKEFDREYGLRTAAKRPEYFCITYVEPALGYSSIFGADASSDPMRWEMMQKAGDTGEIFGTGNVRLIGDEKTDFACGFFLPVYRNELPHNTIEERQENLLGFVVLVFSIGDVVDLSLKELTVAGIDTYIYDKAARPGARILYFSPSGLDKASKALSEEELMHKKGLRYSADFEAAGNTWSVVCLATPEFLLTHRRYGSWVFLLAGLVLTILWVLYLSSIINRSVQVEALVRLRTDELNKANALKEALLNIIPFPMDIVDEEGNIIYVNANMEASTGKDAIGKKCWSLYRDDKQKCSDCPLTVGIKIGETKTIESAGVFGGRIFQISHTGMFFNGRKAVLEIFQDITERKRVEGELLHANEQLMELDKLKTEFVSTVSHELRTPLSITKEGISLVIDKIPGEINEKQEKILVAARDNIDRLARIINELLDISKIESGRLILKKEQVDLLDIVRQTVSSFEFKIKEKGLNIKTDLPEKSIDVYADKDKIIQVFTNLLSNALKFTTKGFIEVSVRESKDTVECSVLDTGTGIPQEDMPKVFSMFQQFGRVAGAGEKGTGLGLSIAKSLVEIHKGNIYVESEEGKGSKFTFALPKYNSERVFKENIDEGIREAIKKDSKLSLIVISVDNFGLLKERLSLEKIHYILNGIAAASRNSLHRQTGVLAMDTREIIVLLPDCQKENCLIVKGGLQQVLSEYLRSNNLSEVIKLRFGCATFPDEAKSDKELIEKAKS